MRSETRVETGSVGVVVRPPNPTETVVLYLPGDRRLPGALEPAPGLAERLSLHTGAVVVAPRHRTAFPAALEDVHAAYDYCRTQGPVAVVGERQGAGLAAALLLRLRDLGEPPPQCGVLVSALLDLTMQAASLQLNATADPTFDVAELGRWAERYAAGTAPTNPLLSPLLANLHGLPPIQLLVAGTDPLLDDSVEFANRAARSGVTVDLHVRPDAASLRSEALTAMAGFIRTWGVRSEGVRSGGTRSRTPAAPSSHPA